MSNFKRFTFIQDSLVKADVFDEETGDFICCTLSVWVEQLVDLLNELNDENFALKGELKGMEELLQSYRRTIEHDAKLLADATKNGYLPPLEDWKKGDME